MRPCGAGDMRRHLVPRRKHHGRKHHQPPQFPGGTHRDGGPGGRRGAGRLRAASTGRDGRKGRWRRGAGLVARQAGNAHRHRRDARGRPGGRRRRQRRHGGRHHRRPERREGDRAGKGQRRPGGARSHRRAQLDAGARPHRGRADASEPREPDPGRRRQHAHVQDLGRTVRRDDGMDEGDARAQGHAVPLRVAQARRSARLLPGHVLQPLHGRIQP